MKFKTALIISIFVLCVAFAVVMGRWAGKEHADWHGFNMSQTERVVEPVVRIDVDATRGQRLAVWSTTDVVGVDTTITYDSIAMRLIDGQIMVVHFVETLGE